MIHALTVDVEDYYSVIARDWLKVDVPPSEAVVRNTSRVLEFLDEIGAVKATFFVLGEVAEAFPALVRDIVAAGHEVGAHGYYHRQFFKLTPQQARREVGDAKKRIEDTIGQSLQGHRAPAFSITPDTKWAFDVLAELGFRYDSSVFPMAGRRYGWPGFPEDIHAVALGGGASIIEAPMSVFRFLGKTLPACGGGYLRHLPYWYTRWAMRRIQRVRPAVVYVHPYEIDAHAGPPEFQRALSTASEKAKRFHSQQLRNRHTVENKLTRLLEDFELAPLCDVINAVLPG